MCSVHSALQHDTNASSLFLRMTFFLFFVGFVADVFFCVCVLLCVFSLYDLQKREPKLMPCIKSYKWQILLRRTRTTVHRIPDIDMHYQDLLRCIRALSLRRPKAHGLIKPMLAKCIYNERTSGISFLVFLV